MLCRMVLPLCLHSLLPHQRLAKLCTTGASQLIRACSPARRARSRGRTVRARSCACGAPLLGPCSWALCHVHASPTVADRRCPCHRQEIDLLTHCDMRAMASQPQGQSLCRTAPSTACTRMRCQLVTHSISCPTSLRKCGPAPDQTPALLLPRSVRRALNLQSGVRHSAPENPCARSGEAPPRAPALAAVRAGPSALLSRSADWQVLAPARAPAEDSAGLLAWLHLSSTTSAQSTNGPPAPCRITLLPLV